MDKPSSPQHSTGNREPHDETASCAADYNEHVSPEANAEDWFSFWETIGIFGFGGFGVGFTEAGLHFGAFLCDFMAVTCGMGVACHQLKRLNKFKSIRKPFIVLVCINFLVFAGLYLYARSSEDTGPRFTGSIAGGSYTAYGRSENAIPIFWFVHPQRFHGIYSPAGPYEASPVYAMFYFRLVNNKEATQISTYWVEVREKDGWKNVPAMDVSAGSFYEFEPITVTNAGRLYVFPDRTRAIKMDFNGEFFQTRLASTGIGHNQTIQGMAFLDSPSKGGWREKRIRLCLKETEDGPTLFVDMPSLMPPSLTGDSIDLQSKPWHFSTGKDFENLGKIPIRFYSDGTEVYPGFN